MLMVRLLNVVAEPVAQEVQQMKVQRDFAPLGAGNVLLDLFDELAVLEAVIGQPRILCARKRRLFRGEGGFAYSPPACATADRSGSAPGLSSLRREDH
jgi:hypothetical protein